MCCQKTTCKYKIVYFQYRYNIQNEFYSLKPVKEEHILKANSPWSYTLIETTSFLSIFRTTVEDPVSWFTPFFPLT